MRMIKNMAVTLAAALVLSCAPKAHKMISPLPYGIDADNLLDCTVPAAFTSDDFRWMGGNLSMTVYGMDLYDAVELSQMHVGDTLFYDNAPMPVMSIEQKEGCVEINGGLDNGGCCLAGYQGGTYIVRNWDDHANYTRLGQAELPLAEDFILIDCGDDPRDPVDTIRTMQKLHIETLKGYKRDFSPLNTLVTVENGMITCINRRWIP